MKIDEKIEVNYFWASNFPVVKKLGRQSAHFVVGGTDASRPLTFDVIFIFFGSHKNMFQFLHSANSDQRQQIHIKRKMKMTK